MGVAAGVVTAAAALVEAALVEAASVVDQVAAEVPPVVGRNQ